MEDDAPDEVEDIIQAAVAMLAAQDFTGLEQWSNGQRLSADDLRTTLTRYGIEPVLPSKVEQLSGTEIYDVTEQRPHFTIDTRLWSSTGPTDLELQLEVFQDEQGHYQLRINDLRVP